ncbi:prostatic acid phosphatase-like [Oppia nitens]|uniref:prostatic acid phosphatase-like n=1 Tax=Oppia nitens TaxID=1686743 RepID=UPI0023DA807C|nr:prostatic acid phosphatase-like [Oppia nitens]
MYRIGQFVRQAYADYLGSQYSPREVYARSSAADRCLESVQLLLAGAYPPTTAKWQWNISTGAQLGSNWQPFPIYTYPAELIDNDTLLRVGHYCPKAKEAYNNNYLKSNRVMSLIKKETEFLDKLGKTVGRQLNDPVVIDNLRDTLTIEYSRKYFWSNHSMWPSSDDKAIVDKLNEMVSKFKKIKYSDQVLKKTGGGPLVKELVNNIKESINGTTSKPYNYKLYLYSTHDIKLSFLLSALNVWNDLLIPFGSSLIVELHQQLGAINGKGYFVRLYYYNETLDDNKVCPYLLKLPNCTSVDCPVDQFYSLTNSVIFNDWNR